MHEIFLRNNLLKKRLKMSLRQTLIYTTRVPNSKLLELYEECKDKSLVSL